ncbi:MAG: hypothetical protein R3A47_00140 [Polyangiales bacterium]
MSWYRGLALGECQDGSGNAIPCRGSQQTVYPSAAIDGTINTSLRSYATILALARFPVYYDTTFEQRLLVFKAGSGDGFDIPDTQPDGTATCAYSSVRLSTLISRRAATRHNAATAPMPTTSCTNRIDSAHLT